MHRILHHIARALKKKEGRIVTVFFMSALLTKTTLHYFDPHGTNLLSCL